MRSLISALIILFNLPSSGSLSRHILNNVSIANLTKSTNILLNIPIIASQIIFEYWPIISIVGQSPGRPMVGTQASPEWVESGLLQNETGSADHISLRASQVSFFSGSTSPVAASISSHQVGGLKQANAGITKSVTQTLLRISLNIISICHSSDEPDEVYSLRCLNTSGIPLITLSPVDSHALRASSITSFLALSEFKIKSSFTSSAKFDALWYRRPAL